MNRRIDELGRLCIPKEMRNKLGIKDNDPVNIECIENKIIITNPIEIDYKEVINKATEYIKERFYFNEETGEYSLLHTIDKDNIKELLDILNKVSE